MQAAFGLGQAAPAPRAVVFTDADGTSAGPAADARVTLVVKRVIGHVVFGDKRPDFLLRPIGQRADFHQAEFLVPADDWGVCPIGALVAADGAGPGVHANDGFLKHLHFSMEAALVGIRPIYGAAVLTLIFFHTRVGSLEFDFDAVAALHFFA